MESYLLKSTICLVVLYGFYRLAFKQNFNHQLKRVIGFSCILFSCSFMLISFGSFFTPDESTTTFSTIFIQSSDLIHERLSQVVPDNLTNSYLIIYFLGVAFFAFRLLFGLLKLIHLYIISRKYKKWGFHVVEIERSIAPFTFFNLLFVGRQNINSKDMKALVVHEKFHRDQYHSVDTILLEILTIIYWFNPIVWMFKRDIRNEHEYMADKQVLKQGFDVLEYQYLLFKASTGVSIRLGNNFSNRTSLKKRISIMNTANRKSNKGYLKALLFIVFMGMILIFSSFIIEHSSKNFLKTDKVQLDTIPENALELKGVEKLIIRSDNLNNSALEPLYVLKEKGKDRVISVTEMRRLDKDKIKGIYVMKGNSAIKKYGDKGKNGVVIITLDKLMTDPSRTKNLNLEPLYVLKEKGNERVISSDQMKKINQHNIKNIKVLKDKESLKKYGKKGKNGVVLIEMNKE